MKISNSIVEMYTAYNTSKTNGNTKNADNTTTNNTKDTDNTETNTKNFVSTTVVNATNLALDNENIKDIYEEILGLSDDNESDVIDDTPKVMKIARRIARGDKVPGYDERKLMEYSRELYQMAKASAMLKRTRKPKKYKSLYKDEDKKAELKRMEKAISNDKETTTSNAGNVSDAPANSEGTSEDM